MEIDADVHRNSSTSNKERTVGYDPANQSNDSFLVTTKQYLTW